MATHDDPDGSSARAGDASSGLTTAPRAHCRVSAWARWVTNVLAVAHRGVPPVAAQGESDQTRIRLVEALILFSIRRSIS